MMRGARRSDIIKIVMLRPTGRRMMEPYTWVMRQIGKHGAWTPYQLAGLPYPPAADDKITFQRFATPECHLGDAHKASFVLDFDAHADWLSVEACQAEVRRFIEAFTHRWNLPPEMLSIAFSGRAGFHVSVPATLLGDIASPHLTTTYKRWATAIKDALGLITLDAPSRRAPEWWWERIRTTLGWLPAAVQDRAAFALALRRVGIYTRRRMIRREGSLHPGSGLYKIPLSPHELALHMDAIRSLAKQPRVLPARLAPSAHPGLTMHVRRLLAISDAQEAQHRNDVHRTALNPRTDPSHYDVVLHADDLTAPLCVQRMLAVSAPDGSSNLPLITLLAYWRATGVSEADATTRAAAWLLRGVIGPDKRRERWDSAHSVARAVYIHRYRFARRFIAPLGLTTDEECGVCPLCAPCWSEKGTTYDHDH
jgi:hypothetical protein